MRDERASGEVDLTEGQQRLLSAFLDDQCGFFNTLRAKNLLSRNAEAVRYLESLKHLSHLAGQFIGGKAAPADLWTRVSARIHQEERSEITLGRRILHQPGGHGHRRLILTSGGLAVTAAALLITVFAADTWQGGVTDNGVVALSGNLPVMRSGVGSSRNADIRPVNLENESTPIASFYSMSKRMVPSMLSKIEVDWLRSRGRVMVIKEPGDGAPTFWVTRRQPMGYSPYQSSSSKSQRIRLLNERVPSAINVSQR